MWCEKMKKSVTKLIANILSVVLLVVLCLNFSPFLGERINGISSLLASASSPDSILTDKKSNISADNLKPKTDNTTTASDDARQAMHAIIPKDSDGDSKITETPADIKKLMSAEKKKISKSKAIGKTSEQAYGGGGTILTCGNIQVQSKIPTSFYKPELSSLLKEGTDLEISDKSEPTILVYHSHTTEAYSLLDVGYYTKADSRSDKSSQNMVRVGDDLVAYLEKAGFNVIHDRKIHDVDYNKSYDSSQEVVEYYLEKYPTIEVTIDVHRDDITFKNKTKIKPTTKVNGKKAARMMIISGCEYGKVKNFPDWKENLKFDLQVQKYMCDTYPDLMRPILFGERKYNMYETHYSFLLEIGTDANTLDEACYSARLFGKGLGDMLNKNYVKKQ